MKRVVLAPSMAMVALASVLAWLAGHPATSRADACVAGPIHLHLYTKRLTTQFSAMAHSDNCVPLTYNANGRVRVRVAGRSYRAHSFTLLDVGTSHQRFTITMPARNVAAARAYARHHHIRSATMYIHLSGTANEDAQRFSGSYAFRLRTSSP